MENRLERLESQLHCIEARAREDTRALRRRLSTEEYRVEEYEARAVQAKAEAHAARAKASFLREAGGALALALSGLRGRHAAARRARDELREASCAAQRESTRLQSERTQERERLEGRLARFRGEWRELYEGRHAKRPHVQRRERAEGELREAQERLASARSALREAQADIFKAKCERGRRTAEESGFYPLSTYLLRVARLGADIKATEREEAHVMQGVARLEEQIRLQKEALKPPPEPTPLAGRQHLPAEPPRTVRQEEYPPNNQLNKPRGPVRFQKEALPEPQLTAGRHQFPAEPPPPVIHQPKLPEQPKKPPVDKPSGNRLCAGVRNRFGSLKLYAPKFFSPPPSQEHPLARVPSRTCEEEPANLPHEPAKRHLLEAVRPQRPARFTMDLQESPHFSSRGPMGGMAPKRPPSQEPRPPSPVPAKRHHLEAVRPQLPDFSTDLQESPYFPRGGVAQKRPFESEPKEESTVSSDVGRESWRSSPVIAPVTNSSPVKRPLLEEKQVEEKVTVSEERPSNGVAAVPEDETLLPLFRSKKKVEKERPSNEDETREGKGEEPSVEILEEVRRESEPETAESSQRTQRAPEESQEEAPCGEEELLGPSGGSSSYVTAPSAAPSAASSSSFDFERHMRALEAIKASPGFTYSTRKMYEQEGGAPAEPPRAFTNSPSPKQPDFMSFAFDDYLNDSPPPVAGDEGAVFAFGGGNNEAKSPLFPLFGGAEKETEEEKQPSGFFFSFGGGDEEKTQDEPSAFKFAF